MIKLRIKLFFTNHAWGHRAAPPALVHPHDLKMLWVCKRLASPQIPLAFQFCWCLIFGLTFSVGNLSAEDHQRKKDGGAYGRGLGSLSEAGSEKVKCVAPMLLSGKQAIFDAAPDQLGRRAKHEPSRGTDSDDFCFSMTPNGGGDLQSISIEKLAVPLRTRLDDALRQVEFSGSEQSSDALADVQAKIIRSTDVDHDADHQWLDIRPRTIAPQEEITKLLRREELPGNETRRKIRDDARDSKHSHAVDYHLLELTFGDFCRVTHFCHGPLRFENRLMESQGVSPGHGCCPPAFYAGAHFIWSAATLPLHVLKQPPCNSVSSGCQYR